MSEPIHAELTGAKRLRFLIVLLLLVSTGQLGNANAQTLTNLYSFVGFSKDGGNPWSPLVQGSDGNFYGTAVGGHYPYNTNYNGIVFRISPSGSFTNLHSFKGNDGALPFSGLVQGSDGNFYGTTPRGGYTNLNNGIGYGTVFRVSPSGNLTSLYSFTGPPSDGAQPYATLVQGSDGNFYGTTGNGGTSPNCSGGCGTVFRISPTGSYSNLFSFTGPPNDGYSPQDGLSQGRDGNFYGTTSFGGIGNIGGLGNGTIFRISPSGSYTSLYSFGSLPDGGTPNAGLVQGSDGNFYGTTGGGGANICNCGTIFRISLSGNYTNIYSFTGPPTDGRFPVAVLVQGSDGNFYGTTQSGGTSVNCSQGCGIIFRISPDGIETNLHSFGNPAGDGIQPNAALLQGSDGNFYSTTTYGGIGGINGSGTVYRLSVPLSPPPYPINQITGVQLSGTNIILNIPSIAGETYQLQFSSSMCPTNWANVPVSVTNIIGALLTLTNIGGASQPQGFYRFDITP
jgi:uncharacterized repeat protein (TIGR03803 family)